MIKKLRETKGLTQAELAKILNLSRSHVSRMENRNIRKSEGYRASYKTIRLLAKTFDECPLKVFAFFANIDCAHIKETNKLRKLLKCRFKKCKINNINLVNRAKRKVRLERENKKLKKQLNIKRKGRKYEDSILFKKKCKRG